MSSGEDRSPSGPGRRMLLVAAGTALALMVLVVLTTAKSSPILQQPSRDPNLNIRHGTYQPPSSPQGQGSGAASTHSQPPGHGGQFVEFVLYVFLIAVLLVILWLLTGMIAAAYRRWKHARRVQMAGPLPEVDDAILDAVAETATRQRQLLHEGTPSNAIVACWVDLERAVASAGVERRPSETSAELTIRVLDNFDVDRRALRNLGGLYRTARYSAHPLTEIDREAALSALARVHTSLGTKADV